MVLLVHKLQGKKTALGSKLPHILAQRLPQGALQSLFIDHSYDITLEESVNVTFANANYKCKVVILEFLRGEEAMIFHYYPETLVSVIERVICM